MVSQITSIHNERVKYIRSLHRRRVREREGRFVVEGTRLVGEAVRAGVDPALVFYTEAWADTPAAARLLPLLARAENGMWLVSDSVLAACAATQTPQGVLVVLPFSVLQPQPGLILVLDGLRNPGNLGTILRSAEAAGVGQVILTPGSVDLYNPKVVRGAMGAHFRLPVDSADWPSISEKVAGRAVWLADMAGMVTYDAVDWTKPSVLILGGEAEGASEAALALSTGRVSIPMAAGVESLNAAMAASVILFEAARQRRSRAGKEPL
jgi:TrmH family RNA methyltransferase